MNYLKTVFNDLIIQFNPAGSQQEQLWLEIENAYTESGRHYHNLDHIEYVIKRLIEVKSHIENWNTLLFACFYHDFVYNPASRTNEEESAIIASERMNELMIAADVIGHCNRMIMATQTHSQHPDQDIMFFIDADLAILGSDSETYEWYSKAIRQEYHMFDDNTYKNGRKKVLEYFSLKPQIFNTAYFNNKYEAQARINITRELGTL